MSRKFNITGTCTPEKHYMVNISSKLEQIKNLIDDKQYFTINRGRQYGKTTTLSRLRRFLANEYTVISITFQGLGDTSFATEEAFCQAFINRIRKNLRFSNASKAYQENWNKNVQSIEELSDLITERCLEEKIVLMIDEVDQASNYRVFLSFLSMLRDKFLLRSDELDATFHSVILAGVYDIKNIKFKMISDGLIVPKEGERKINSPWNIAVPFEVEMSFSIEEISGMLTDYELDHRTGMNISEVSEEIHSYTSGYPFLVSRICGYIHEKLEKNWSKVGVLEAVRFITEEPQPNTLFDDLFKNIRNNEHLSNFLYDILLAGKQFRFAPGVDEMAIGLRYDFIKIVNGQVRIHNKVFEIVMTNYFIESERIAGEKTINNEIEPDVVNDNKFNIELFFEKFNAHYQQRYAHKDIDFLEREAAFLFLFFLQPYLNGNGFYFLQAEPSAGKRMDVVIVYGNEEFIVELKVWRGQKRHADGQKQLLGYMEKRRADKGYLLTFDFRKKREQKYEWIEIDGKSLLEVQV